MDQRRAEPEISEVRDRRRLDRTSANPPWPQASKQASKTRRGRGDALPDRAAQHCAARIDSRGRGVKLEWERIYLGGQGGRPDEGIGNTNWSAAGRARARTTSSQRAGAVPTVVRINLESRRGNSVAGGCSLFGRQISSLAMAECRVLLQSVLSGRSSQL